MKAQTRIAAGAVAIALALGGVTATASAHALPAADPIDDYQIVEPLMDEHPSWWAGAFIEDGVLIVRTTLTVAQATRILTDAGVSSDVVVRHSDVSQADLAALVQEIIALHIEGMSSIGPSYSRGQVRVSFIEITPQVDELIATYGDRIFVEIGAYATAVSYDPNAPKPAYVSWTTRAVNQRFARLITQWSADSRALSAAGRRAGVLPTGLTSWKHARPDLPQAQIHRATSFRTTAQDNVIRVRYAFGDCTHGDARVRVRETDQAVYVAVFRDPIVWRGATPGAAPARCSARVHIDTQRVVLADPLAGRPVIDAYTGQSISSALKF